jgi:hypothetical protein
MNSAVFEAGPLELEGLGQAREVLRCACAMPRCARRTPPMTHPSSASLRLAGLLHTVLFHRALGVVRPKDTQLSLFDVVFVS